VLHEGDNIAQVEFAPVLSAETKSMQFQGDQMCQRWKTHLDPFDLVLLRAGIELCECREIDQHQVDRRQQPVDRVVHVKDTGNLMLGVP
jgi:hypothetical protein